eukprot:scaffold40197_cov32-Attheya_sp.AAC.1
MKVLRKYSKASKTVVNLYRLPEEVRGRTRILLRGIRVGSTEPNIVRPCSGYVVPGSPHYA